MLHTPSSFKSNDKRKLFDTFPLCYFSSFNVFSLQLTVRNGFTTPFCYRISIIIVSCFMPIIFFILCLVYIYIFICVSLTDVYHNKWWSLNESKKVYSTHFTRTIRKLKRNILCYFIRNILQMYRRWIIKISIISSIFNQDYFDFFSISLLSLLRNIT